MVTIVSEENTYKTKDEELDKLEEGFEGGDYPLITNKYLENFPDDCVVVVFLPDGCKPCLFYGIYLRNL